MKVIQIECAEFYEDNAPQYVGVPQYRSASAEVLEHIKEQSEQWERQGAIALEHRGAFGYFTIVAKTEAHARNLLSKEFRVPQNTLKRNFTQSRSLV